MIRLQIRLCGLYFSSFSTHSYSYEPSNKLKLFSNIQIFASARIVRQAPRLPLTELFLPALEEPGWPMVLGVLR